MVFKRRDQATIWQKAREAIYPRKGWRRGIDYYSHRIKRIPDTPHKIALGFAAGLFASFTPFFGLHLVLGAVFAWIVRGNILAGIVATFTVNPITLPFIAGISLWTGRKIFGIGSDSHSSVGLVEAFADGFVGMWQVVGSWVGLGKAPWGKLAVFWQELLFPYLIGGILPGLLFAAISYYLTAPLIAAYQKRRRAKFLERARQKLHDKQRAADLAISQH